MNLFTLFHLISYNIGKDFINVHVGIPSFKVFISDRNIMNLRIDKILANASTNPEK